MKSKKDRDQFYEYDVAGYLRRHRVFHCLSVFEDGLQLETPMVQHKCRADTLIVLSMQGLRRVWKVLPSSSSFKNYSNVMSPWTLFGNPIYQLQMNATCYEDLSPFSQQKTRVNLPGTLNREDSMDTGPFDRSTSV